MASSSPSVTATRPLAVSISFCSASTRQRDEYRADTGRHITNLQHVHIVLSHPSEPRNVGAVCRAIKNAGITRLTIVTDSEIDLDAARPLAVDARDILDTARIVPDLPAALTGSTLIAGVTRRVGQRRKVVSFAPWQLARKAADLAVPANNDRAAGNSAAVKRGGATVSIVFGNEQSGLSDAELELCHMAVGIPSSPEFPSLNLSHAVQIIVYELYISDLARRAGTGEGTTSDAGRAGNESAIAGRVDANHQPRIPFIHAPIDAQELTTGVERIVNSLENLGFHTQAGPQGMRVFLTDILGRAILSQIEIRRLREMFAKLEGMHGRGE